jgi:hypothetical protein
MSTQSHNQADKKRHHHHHHHHHRHTIIVPTRSLVVGDSKSDGACICARSIILFDTENGLRSQGSVTMQLLATQPLVIPIINTTAAAAALCASPSVKRLPAQRQATHGTINASTTHFWCIIPGRGLSPGRHVYDCGSKQQACEGGGHQGVRFDGEPATG